MALRLAGEEYSVIQGLDSLGWPREIEANDADPGLKITQSGAGAALDVQGKDILLGAGKLKTTNLILKELDSNTLVVRDAADTIDKDIEADNITSQASFLAGANGVNLSAANIDAAAINLKARDSGVGLVKVARLVGAADAYLEATLPMVLKPSSEPGTLVEGHFWYDAVADLIKYRDASLVQALDRVLKPYVAKTANYTVLATDRIIGVDTTGGAVTITIPSALITAGRTLIIKDEGGNAGTNNITIATEGAETIDGAATDTLNTDYESQGYYSDGSNWFKV